ncbi:MAG: Obg family GTPase CgtA, partial [Firmicutes bacterium]|nr:Obg family GTPase CgtA [Bacillota bacterium]
YPIPGEDGFVIADLPGLIEGASSGIGLGHRFLRHAERTRVMVHVLDMSEYSDRDPLKDFEIINEELRLYKQNFMARPQLIAANKMDTEGSAERLEQLREYIGDRYPIYPISALTGEGVQELLMAVYNTLLTAPPIEEEAPPQEDVRVTVVRDEAPFVIEEEEPGVWRVTGKRIENLVQLTNLDNEDALMRMQRTIVQMGLEDALRAKGVEPGDTVCILDVEFEYAE